MKTSKDYCICASCSCVSEEGVSCDGGCESASPSYHPYWCNICEKREYCDAVEHPELYPLSKGETFCDYCPYRSAEDCPTECEVPR